MNCIVIDDEELARAIIHQFATDNPYINSVECFSSGIDAIKYLNNNNTINIIFLDIHMPNFNGIDFVQTYKNSAKIILTTSDKNFALEAFEYDNIVDYLLKPLSKARFSKAIGKAVVQINCSDNDAVNTETQDENFLYVNIDRKLIKICIPTIQVIEAKGDYILIKTTEKNYTVHSTLKKIEQRLNFDYFIKAHRSYIINIREIIDIEDNTVLIAKYVIPLSRSNRPELMKRLNLL